MLLALLLIAAEPVDVIAHEGEAPARNFVNVRVGGTASPSQVGATPSICVEASPVEFLGVEACGNGSGFLHHQDVPEIAQFKAKVRGPALKNDELWVEPWLGVGFAEMQLAEDAPGFYFADTGPLGVETAGPLVSGNVRALVPLAEGFELVADVGAGAAFFVEAPRLSTPQSPWQLLVGASLGVGF